MPSIDAGILSTNSDHGQARRAPLSAVHSAIALTGDVTRPTTFARAVAATLEEFVALDILVNNAQAA